MAAKQKNTAKTRKRGGSDWGEVEVIRAEETMRGTEDSVEGERESSERTERHKSDGEDMETEGASGGVESKDGSNFYRWPEDVYHRLC